MRLAGVGDSGIATSDIDGVWNRVHVRRVDARLVSALVIQLQTIADGADNLLVDEDVSRSIVVGTAGDDAISA
jgi:hypothetical protein